MSLKPHEQRTLGQIEAALRAGDPKLAGMLSVFTKLTAFEAIPVDECVPASPAWPAAPTAMPARRAIPGSRRDTASRAGVMSPPGAMSGWTRGNLLMTVALVLVLLISAIAAGCAGPSRPESHGACRQALVLARPCTPISPSNSVIRGMTAPEGSAGQPDRAAEAAPAGRVSDPGP